jgi:thiamine-monophosphate kinase
MRGLGEFELIRRFFVREGVAARSLLGIGDDCALLATDGAEAIAVSTDMLVEGRHFFADVDPVALGHKTLAVNLSDLAAMGARPDAFTLAIALPQADAGWLQGFAQGLFALADAHGCELVGGDTTRGPLNLCVTVFGRVPPAEALRRDRARGGDDVWVSGALGAAGWAVDTRLRAGRWPTDEATRSALAGARERLERPHPRVALGMALRGVAHAAIDLSDGLLGDLGHVLERSGAAAGHRLGARLRADAIPVDPALDALPAERRLALALTGGDDYELLFTAPADRREAIGRIAAGTGLTLSRIGVIDDSPGVRLVDASGHPVSVHDRSFDHFR